VQLALTVDTLVLKARNLLNFEAGSVDTYINQRFHFKTVTVDLYIVKTVSPEDVVAVAQIAET